MPEGRADACVQALLLALSAAVLLAMPPDGRFLGGRDLTDAAVILRGGIPYRDFWTLYAPGHFYILAGLLAIFGRHSWLSGLAAGTCFAVAVPLFYGMLRQLGASRAWALVGALIPLGAALTTPYYRQFGTYAPTLVFLLLAWRSYLRRLAEGEAPARLFSTGLWLGAAALCKHDVAAYSAIAMVSGLLLDGALQRKTSRSARSVGWMVLGALLVFGPPMLALASLAWHEIVRDVFVFPATTFRYARPEHYPDLIPHVLFEQFGSRRAWLFAAFRWAAFALTLGAAMVGALFALMRRRVVGAERDLRPAFLALAVAFAFHFVAAHVQINTHIISMALFAVALAVALDARWVGARRRRALFLAAGLGWVAIFVAEPVLAPLLNHRNGHLVDLDIPGARSARLFPEDADDLRKLRAIVQALVPPGDPIFVAEVRNDIVINNAVDLYYLLDRPGATRYYEMHPAVTDTTRVQREIVDDLDAKRPRLVLLRKVFKDSELDHFEKSLRKHVPDVGSEILDTYLRRHYQQIAVLGRIRVLALKDDGADGPLARARTALPGEHSSSRLRRFTREGTSARPLDAGQPVSHGL